MTLSDLPLIEGPPVSAPQEPVPVLFTTEQVAIAVAAAVEAHAAGDDPKAAALAAISEPGETPP